MNKTCIIITGPTAVGKTALAIAVAKHFSTSIISADSRQCFKELNIGVARPSPAELASVHHYFIASHSIHDKVNAAVFEQYALEKLQEIFHARDIAVMVGGTGLYIKAFTEGLDEVPFIPPTVKEKIIAEYHQRGLAWLQNETAEKDPLYYEQGEIKNPHRLMRALEVKIATGKSILEFQTRKGLIREFKILRIGIELPRQFLYGRINNRVDQMIKDGLLVESASLKQYQHLNALQTVGYQELFDYMDGNISLPAAIDAIKANTRRYAKRQMTWFKKDEAVEWCEPAIDPLMEVITRLL